MSDRVERLVELVAPVGTVRQHDWTSARALVDDDLPADYVRLVDTYGAGQFDGFLWIYEPDCINPYFDLVPQAAERAEALDELWSDGEERPEGVESAASLIAWAGTDNGDYVYWHRPAGATSGGRVLVNESRGPSWVSYAMSPTEFLHGLLIGDIAIDFFEGWLPQQDHTFKPVEPFAGIKS
jgi:hypothetical protein